MSSDKQYEKYYLKKPFLYLVSPDSLSNKEIMDFDLRNALDEFYQEMKKQPELDYKILGLCMKSAAKLHKKRVSRVISSEKKSEKMYQESQNEEIASISDEPFKRYIDESKEVDAVDKSEDFFENLLIDIHTEIRKRKKKKKEEVAFEEIIADDVTILKDTDESKELTKQPQRKRKIRVKETFDAIQISMDRLDIHKMINHVLSIIKELNSQLTTKKEIDFMEILHRRVADPKDVGKLKLEHVRVLMSLLYLIMEGFTEAWQDIDTGLITVSLTEKGKKQEFKLESM